MRVKFSYYNISMTKTHILGFPRLGPDREYKKALEAYWKGKIDKQELEARGAQIRSDNWQIQQDAGLDYVSVGDFAWYDHILNASMTFGVIPARFKQGATDDLDANLDTNLDTMFRMARGRAPTGEDAHACEMTKWFNTNYHYIVPEFENGQKFKLTDLSLVQHIKEASGQEGAPGCTCPITPKKVHNIEEPSANGPKVKATLIGPLSYLWLGRCVGGDFDKLSLLDDLVSSYIELLRQIKELGVEWIQLDEPILALDLPDAWQKAYKGCYEKLGDPANSPNIMLTTYFGGLANNLKVLQDLQVAGVHLDTTRSDNWRQEAQEVLKSSKSIKALSLGVINGRDVWRANLPEKMETLKEFADGEHELWVGSSCSLLHTPVDLDSEKELDAELKQWLAFAKQKTGEVAVLARALQGQASDADKKELAESGKAAEAHKSSGRIHKQEVADAVAGINADMLKRQSPYSERANMQKEHIKLPHFPTTTIGSFPQTGEIRVLRGQFKKGEIDEASYTKAMQEEIADTVKKQEDFGLDVFVHGEPERNDMVEYFGEMLDGMAVTSYGWVQSYGSRCVKPPIIYGDVTRPDPMTVRWLAYANEISKKPMKAMLTGPVTILCWSFVRDDLPRSAVAMQIALALREETLDLEKAGMQIIQIDEPAMREGLPLRKSDWAEYLKWAVESFRLSSCSVQDQTQIHTHMCYSEFNDIIDSIAGLDADVISIECSRSKMHLLDVFDKFKYPNEIGPGVYDIHSPLVPEVSEIEHLLQEAAKKIPAERLWVNPDCGLKTRAWPETEAALKNMVTAANNMRARFAAS